MPIGSKQLIREYWEFSSIESVKLPITHRDNDVDKHEKAYPHVENWGPGCDQWTAVISWDPSPIKGEGTNAKSMVSRPDLLSCDTMGPHPTNPWEECQDWEQIARESIISEACHKCSKKKLHSSQAFLFRVLFMECSVTKKVKNPKQQSDWDDQNYFGGDKNKTSYHIFLMNSFSQRLPLSMIFRT